MRKKIFSKSNLINYQNVDPFVLFSLQRALAMSELRHQISKKKYSNFVFIIITFYNPKSLYVRQVYTSRLPISLQQYILLVLNLVEPANVITVKAA